MFIDPATLADDLQRLEEIEKASSRLVTHALVEFRDQAADIYAHESDKAQDIGEDITREALDRMGVSRIDQRLFGKMDYKRARYVFHPSYAIRQALFVDSKAEDLAGQQTATLQIAQTSMRIRQLRGGIETDEAGTLPRFLELGENRFLTTTIFVKYNYQSVNEEQFRLNSITVACVPNVLLQEQYNPDARDTIWLVGRNAPRRGEPFRVRLSFPRLKLKSNWRVQHIPLSPAPFTWDD